jgi:hypothetical protein
VLDVPLVGDRVAPVDELESVPLEDEAHRPIQAVNGRDAADDHAVLFEDHLVHAVEGELVDLQHPSAKVDHARADSYVPDVHLLVELLFVA